MPNPDQLSFTTVILVTAGLFLPRCASGQVEPVPDQLSTTSKNTWHVSFSPYLWLAGLDGNLSLAGREAAVQQSFGDILSNLKIGVMGLTEVRRGRVGVLTDLLFVRVGDQRAIAVPQLPFPVDARVTTNTFTLTPELAYRVYSQKHLAVDLLGGIRYYHLGAKSTFDAGPLGQNSYTASDNWADAVGGARFLVRMTPKIGAFFIGDAGGGGSASTWQIAFGAGYRVTTRTTMQIGYRRLYFDRQDGTISRLDATQQGVVLGTTIHFR